jgi:hypothetical protein
LKFIGLTSASLLATLITPYGLKAWDAIVQTFRRPEILNYDTEWQPLFVFMRDYSREFHSTNVFVLLLLTLFAISVVLLIVTPRGGDLPLVAVAALLVVSAFVSMRNLPLAAIALGPPLARHLQLIRDRLGTHFRRAPQSSTHPPPALSLTGHVLVTVLAIGVAIQTGLLSSTLRCAKKYPAGAVNFMNQNSLSGNVLADFAWGEYILFHGAPRMKVFIDGRYQLVYPAPLIREYVAFYRGAAEGRRLLDEYPHDFVLVPVGSPSANLMATRKDWTVVYSDSDSVLFARTGARATMLLGVPVKGVAPASLVP